jgi:hypothetical protein
MRAPIIRTATPPAAPPAMAPMGTDLLVDAAPVAVDECEEEEEEDEKGIVVISVMVIRERLVGDDAEGDVDSGLLVVVVVDVDDSDDVVSVW